jgi:uncharacterized protein
MKFIRYTTAAAFAADVTETLNKHEIQNNLLLLNINGGLTRTDNTNMVMAAVKDEHGKILLTAVRTRPHPLVIYETDNIRNDSVLEFFASSLIDNGIEADIFMSEKACAEKLSALYGRLTGRSFYKHESLVLYTLDKVSSLSLPNGSFRKASDSDMFYLPYWLADFVPACHLGDYNLDAAIINAKRLIAEGSAYIWEDTAPAAVAARVRQTSDCAFIGQVYTPPHLRGKGCSTACVSQLSQKLFDDGFTYCALYADCANPYSNKVYKSIGYKEVFYYDQYKLEQG